jgi:hypothetical protein
MATLKAEFPNSENVKYNTNFVSGFNNNLNKVQVFIDKTVANNLMPYVSLRSGTQEKSIKLATDLGSGIVEIGVPYAEYQAYSKRIKRRVGKRGTQPFERMKADKKDSILRQTANYQRSLENG